MNEYLNNAGRRRYASKSAKLRRAMMSAVTEADVYEIVKLQVFLARKGDPIATREVLDRVVGKPMSMDAVIEMEDRSSANEPDIGMTTLSPADAEALAMDGTVPPVVPVPHLPEISSETGSEAD